MINNAEDYEKWLRTQKRLKFEPVRRSSTGSDQQAGLSGPGRLKMNFFFSPKPLRKSVFHEPVLLFEQSSSITKVSFLGTKLSFKNLSPVKTTPEMFLFQLKGTNMKKTCEICL